MVVGNHLQSQKATPAAGQAARRQMFAGAPVKDDHDTVLAGAWPANSTKTGPSIVQRTDEDFIAATLAEIASPDAQKVVSDHRPASENNALKLFQPVHRTFNLVLVEAHCDTFMSPRLDPKKIASSGMVVRRLGKDSLGQTVYEGWCSAAGKIQGWTKFVTAEQQDRDPDPALRPATRLTADPEFDAAFRGPPDPTSESVTTLFIAPADAVQATSRTLLYGVIPVTSTSRAGEPAPAENQPDQAAWSQHLVSALKSSSNETSLGMPGGTLNANDVVDYGDTLFIKLLLQLRQEFGLFRDDSPARAAQVINLLNQLTIKLQDGTTQQAGTYLATAAHVLIDQDNTTPPPRPDTWPAVDSTLANNLYNQLRPLAEDMRKALVAPSGCAGRYDDLTALYVVRSFIRVKRTGGCPPRLIWSDCSEPFRIAPWYETGPAAPVQITLPDPFDRNFLKKTKPGVSFSVPEKLANFLNTDGKSLLNGGSGSGLTLDWICGFSIPIITICAFIMLSIILSLLNIIFFWLPLVKICIPFPRKK